MATGFIKMQATLSFNDDRILRYMDRKARRGLNRYGATVRMYARRSMRRVKYGAPASLPGQPPKARKGTIRDRLFYAYSTQTNSVVVGPEKFHPGSGAPEVLEYGGISNLTVPRRQGKGSKMAAVRVAARPFMQPVHSNLMHKLPQYIAGSVR